MTTTKDRLVERFIKYTKIDTMAIDGVDTTPSSPGQLELAKIVADDLRAEGLTDVELTEDGFIYATIPSNLPDDHPAKDKVKTIGYFAHLDTATEASGANVKARIIENYQGEEITYTANPELKLNTEIAPHLKKCIGDTIITSDGTTLLGGDDKAALSVLVELVKYYKDNPDVLHGKIRLGIIPDEEIGIGTEKFDLEKFGADVAYTVDGGEKGEIDVASFNGFKANVSVDGVAAFPGYGKGLYVNAVQILSKFIAKMNEERWPQNCDGRQPIWWAQEFNGDVAHAEATVFLRDFELDGIKEQEKLLNEIKESLLKDYPKSKINVDVKEMYKNYKYELDKDPSIVANAELAMRNLGIEPQRNCVRGGNDSCHLCFSGLLSTNIFIGMENLHSLIEWISAETIEASFKTVVELGNVWLKHAE